MMNAWIRGARLTRSAVCLGVCLLSLAAQAEMAGKVVSSSGKVLVRNEDSGSAMRPLRAGDALEAGTVINTDSGGSAKLLMTDKTIIDLGPSTLFKVDEYKLKAAADRSVGLTMAYGKIRASVNTPVGPKGRFTIRTKTATMGVRGTEFVVLSDLAEATAPAPAAAPGKPGAPANPAKPAEPKAAGPKTQITVIHGKVEVSDKAAPKKPIALTDGTQLTTSAERKPAAAGAPAIIEAPKVVKLTTEQVKLVQVDAKTQDRTFIQAVAIDKSLTGGTATTGLQTLSAISESFKVSLPADMAPPSTTELGIAGTFGSDFGMHQSTAAPVIQQNLPVTLRVVFQK